MRLGRPSSWKWRSLCLGLLSASFLTSPQTRATGFYGPNDYLAEGGRNVDTAPEFYWEQEVKRLAREFRPADAPATSPAVFPPQPPSIAMYSLEEALQRPTQLTAEADTEDFKKALREGRIKPPDPAAAQQRHEQERAALQTDPYAPAPGPPEFPSEFADYHQGARAFRKGKEGWADARAAWGKLLQRPPAERPYRTVWATFMLGKLALKEGRADAPQRFQQTRALAREGFADSLGMAADSYGWEGRSEWKQGHPEKAARLFLTQLALGDESAIDSLKALIPDRPTVPEMLNYGPEVEEMEKWTEQQQKDYAQKEQAGLRGAVRDPVLRRLVTAHILCEQTVRRLCGEGDPPAAGESRIGRWLRIIQEAKVEKTEDAEYLGWAAYHVGDYAGAAHWLELSAPSTPAAHWLRAKLQRRAGKLEEAARSMVLAWRGIHEAPGYTGWAQPPPADGTPENLPMSMEGEGWNFEQAAGGDLGGFALARGDFLQAFVAFRQGLLWEDAAFVAESILTVDELKEYVDHEPTPPRVEDSRNWAGNREALRWLLGRRLVRVDRYAEAAAYLKPPYDKVLAVYAKALETGANEKLPKADRARGWFTAAWLARHEGLELMGTEMAPDGFFFEGNFEPMPTALERRTGRVVPPVEEDEVAKARLNTKPISLPATPQEIRRLQANRVAPELRWHYRIIAGALAMKAAGLLPDNSEALADVINTAGLWVKTGDPELANKYFAVLEHRANRTAIGRAARATHWFVESPGSWSKRERAARLALRSELKMETE